MGRIDNQIKIRGFRVELGEIETVMRQHQQIIDCAVAVKEEGVGDSRLIAYVVWQEEPLTMTDIRKNLRDSLPAYMIPQHIIDITELPLTPNGKLDRKSLPELFTNTHHESEYIEPKTNTERWLAQVWQDTLGIEKVSLYDNFFDLGGHSLLSMQIIYKIEKDKGIKLNPRYLYLDTLEKIAQQIAPADK